MPFKRRIEYLDIAKAILIFTVILGHTVDVQSVPKTWIYAFHMPAFFWISGMVHRTVPKDSFRNWVQDRFVRIALPYTFWALFYTKFSFKNLFFLIYGSRETLVAADTLSSLWYLPSFLVALVIVEIGLRISNRFDQRNFILILYTVFLIGVGFAIPHLQPLGLPWGLDVGVISSVFLLLGQLSKVVLSHAFKSVIGRIGLFGIGTLMLYTGVEYNRPLGGYVLMAQADYGNPLLFIIGAVGGTLTVLSVAMIVTGAIGNCRSINCVGKNTLGIFLVHKPFVEAGKSALRLLGVMHVGFIVSLLLSIGYLIVATIVVIGITRKIPIVFGKKV